MRVASVQAEAPRLDASCWYCNKGITIFQTLVFMDNIFLQKIRYKSFHQIFNNSKWPSW